MKAGIHPEYRKVVFADTSSDFKILTGSTLSSKDTIEWEDGETYPLIKVEISSASHPFFTGKQKLMDTAGRIDKFRRRYGIKSKEADDAPEADAAETDAAETAETAES